MFGTRHAVVVTHSRLRESGTVVEEAVEQLTQAGFEVSIIDNIEAPDFGRQSPVVPERTEIVVVLGGDGSNAITSVISACTVGICEDQRFTSSPSIFSRIPRRTAGSAAMAAANAHCHEARASKCANRRAPCVWPVFPACPSRIAWSRNSIFLLSDGVNRHVKPGKYIAATCLRKIKKRTSKNTDA